MRAAIYVTAILGLVFFTIASIGYFIDFSHYKIYFILSFCLILFGTLPLYIFQQLQYTKRKADILKTYKKKKRIENDSEKDSKATTTYPAFRNKKSGLTWGGGNIHGAGAKRGTKKGFLKH